MQFEKGYIYHVYNQGNNHQNVFFDRENYLFFLKKIKLYVLPYADIIAWCLMPNHFHIMLLINEIEILVEPLDDSKLSDGSTGKLRTFNDSIAIMLRSYTRAINKQKNRSGTLFRQKTKAECVNCPGGVTPSFYNTSAGSRIVISDPEKQYPQICFNYIHQNPVKAGLVKQDVDWEFSSAVDYYGNRNGKLINKKVAKEYIDF